MCVWACADVLLFHNCMAWSWLAGLDGMFGVGLGLGWHLLSCARRPTSASSVGMTVEQLLC